MKFCILYRKKEGVLPYLKCPVAIREKMPPARFSATSKTRQITELNTRFSRLTNFLFFLAPYREREERSNDV